MTTKGELSRITIDVPKALHKRLKTCAALQGKSMREIILDALELAGACHLSTHVPNKTTHKAIKAALNKEKLVEIKSIKDFFKKMGV